MKINFIVPEIVRSGGIRVIFEFANKLTLRGHDVLIYTPMIPFNTFRPKIKSYVAKHQLRYFMKQAAGKPFMPGNIFSHNFQIKAVPAINNFFIRNADIMFATSWTSSFHVYKLNNSKGIKFYFIQDYEIWNSNEELVKQSYTLPMKRIVIAEHLQRFLKEKFNSDSEVIRYGLNFDIFNNEAKDYDTKPKSLLFMDHQLKNKNAEAAIKTIVKIKEHFPEVIARGFGMHRYHDIPGFIDFTVNPDDKTLAELYRSSDIYIYPTLFEGCPTTPLEAMACKCAVVANASAEIPYYVKDKESGILADPAKPEELFEGVSWLLNNPEKLSIIAENGYRNAHKLFDWEKSTDKLESILKTSVETQAQNAK
jgi:glycosyltransferase involved in cell wall biosynthesis